MCFSLSVTFILFLCIKSHISCAHTAHPLDRTFNPLLLICLCDTSVDTLDRHQLVHQRPCNKEGMTRTAPLDSRSLLWRISVLAGQTSSVLHTLSKYDITLKRFPLALNLCQSLWELHVLYVKLTTKASSCCC